MHIASEIQSWREGPSLSCQLHFQSARKTKNAFASSLKFKEMSKEGTRRKKTHLKTYLRVAHYVIANSSNWSISVGYIVEA